MSRPKSTENMPSRRNTWPAFAAFLLLGVVLRMVFVVQMQASPLFSSPVGPDVSEYWSWASSILGGHWLWDTVPLHAPLYAFVLAAGRWLTRDSFFALHLLQLLLGLLAQALAARAAWRCFGRGAGLAALALGVLHLPVLFYDAQFYAEGLLVLLVAAVLWLTAAWPRPLSMRRAGLVGLLLGLAVLTHSRAALFAVGMLGWLALAALRDHWRLPSEPESTASSTDLPKRRGAWPPVIVAIAACVLPILPVCLYNTHLAGNFTFIQRHEGLNLFIGNNPQADGTPNVRVGPDWDRLVARPRLEGHTTTDAGARAWFQSRVWEYVTSSPASWAALEMRKLALGLTAREVTASAPYATLAADVPLLRLPLLGFGVLLPLACVGLVAGGWRVIPAVWLLLSTLLTMLLFVAAGRYRLEMLPTLWMFGGCGVAQVCAAVGFERTRAGKSSAPPPASSAERAGGPCSPRVDAHPIAPLPLILVALAIGLLAAYWPLAYDARSDEAEGAQLRGMAWLLKQDRPHAEIELRKAVALRPDFVNAVQILGEIVADSGRVDEGLALMQRSIELDGRWARSLDRLSGLLARRGDRDGALQFAQRALEVDPLTGSARLRLATLLAEGGQTEAAEQQFDQLLTQTSQPEIYLQYSTLLRRAGRWAKMADTLKRGVARFPNSDTLAVRLARVLAACPEAAVRSAPEALTIAEHAVAIATERRAEALDVLAMALAANGRFADAAAKAQQALSASRNPDFQALVRERLALYQAGRAYVDGGP